MTGRGGVPEAGGSLLLRAGPFTMAADIKDGRAVAVISEVLSDGMIIVHEIISAEKAPRDGAGE